MNRLNLMAATLLAIGGSLGLAGCNKEESADSRTPGQKAGDVVQKGVDSTTRNVDNAAKATGQGINNAATKAAAVLSPTGADSAKGVRNAIEGIVTNAVDKNNYTDLTGYFTKSDKERLNASKPDTADVDAAIEQFKKAWKDKYGKAFRIGDSDQLYGESFVHVGVAPAADPATTTRATVAASHGMPELMLPFVQQGGLWKLDVADTLDGKQLHDSLLKAINELNKDPAAWPADQTDAYRLVTHHLLMAIVPKA